MNGDTIIIPIFSKINAMLFSQSVKYENNYCIIVGEEEMMRHVPLEDGHVPLEDGHVPLEDGHVPLEDGHVPLEDGHVPLEDGHVPLEDGHVPLEDGHVPLEDGHVPLEEGHASLWLWKCLGDGAMKLSKYMYFKPCQKKSSHPAVSTSK